MDFLLENIPLPILVLTGYLFVISAVTYFVFATDKSYAVSGTWRTKEKTLLILTLLGGTIGAVAAMKNFRHKTRKTSFLLPFLGIVSLQIFLIILVWYYVFGGVEIGVGLP